MNPSDISRLLYVRLDGIGDSILTGGLLEGLPELFPGARVTVMCDTAAAPLYLAAPMVHTVVPLDKTRLAEPDHLRRAVALARACKADAVFNSTLSPYPEVCALLLNAGAPLISTDVDTANMSAEEKDFFESRVSLLIPRKQTLRMDAERATDMLEFFGIAARPQARLWLGEEDRRRAREIWRQTGFDPEKTIALFACGGIPNKMYLEFGQALADLCLRRGLGVAALGAPGDAAANEHNLRQLAARGVPVANLCGLNLPLLCSAALLGDCLLAVGADTGLAHAACALNKALVVLTGGGHFGRFLPYHRKSVCVCLPLACYQCNWRCPFERALCVADIAPETVRQAVEWTLDRQPGAERRTLFLQPPEAWPPRPGRPDAPHWPGRPDWPACPPWQSPDDFIRACEALPDNGLDLVFAAAPAGALVPEDAPAPQNSPVPKGGPA